MTLKKFRLEHERGGRPTLGGVEKCLKAVIERKQKIIRVQVFNPLSQLIQQGLAGGADVKDKFTVGLVKPKPDALIFKHTIAE